MYRLQRIIKEVSSSYTISCSHPSDTVSVFVCTMGCEQAESFGTTILDEDGLLELIRTKPGKKSKYEIAAEAEVSAHIFIFNHAVKESFHHTGIILTQSPFLFLRSNRTHEHYPFFAVKLIF